MKDKMGNTNSGARGVKLTASQNASRYRAALTLPGNVPTLGCIGQGRRWDSHGCSDVPIHLPPRELLTSKDVPVVQPGNLRKRALSGMSRVEPPNSWFPAENRVVECSVGHHKVKIEQEMRQAIPDETC